MRVRASAPRERLSWLTLSFALGVVRGLWILITAMLIYWGVASYYQKDDFRKRAVQIESFRMGEYEATTWNARTGSGSTYRYDVYDLEVFAREFDRSLPAFLEWRAKWVKGNTTSGKGETVWVDPRDVCQSRHSLPTDEDLRSHIRGSIASVVLWFVCSWWAFSRMNRYAASQVSEIEYESGTEVAASDDLEDATPA